MSKFLEISAETKKVFDKSLGNSILEREVNIKILANNSLKIIGQVVKANPLVKYLCNEDVVVLINEVIFDQLTPLQQTIVADELLANIAYNMETGAVSIIKPEINIHSGVLAKFGADACIKLSEQIKLMFEQEKEKEAQEKADKAAKAALKKASKK
jgi:hypothetical protein